ncbi:Crp/Fnr family transcriptional regulator [Sphaerochaeta sp. PS]|uniref:Crp/Fnr family transcriptional regulator n=1 Tax=Sphaerochaeta sp. PS TaxID=3076336 RepID=UPI0028A3B254|nr:Crp/Fnr family transcriptional regulator [Sphaerochaeta sp. PS]MDT4761795.1 Crp/Fnr family transcriptional regulator [Sphaerochaeta sp. PS]
MQCDHHGCLHIVPLFQNLDAEQMGAIDAITREGTYSNGQPIYHAGEASGSLMVVHTGKVKIYRLDSEGEQQVMRILLPGEFAGELALFSKEPTQDYAEAIGECSLCMINGEHMRGLMIKYPSIALKITQELSMRLSQSDATLHGVVKGSVEQRLAGYLFGLLKKSQTNHIQLPVAKGTVASLLAMSQETLSRRLKILQDDGVIELGKGRKITVLDTEALEDRILQ